MQRYYFSLLLQVDKLQILVFSCTIITESFLMQRFEVYEKTFKVAKYMTIIIIL